MCQVLQYGARLKDGNRLPANSISVDYRGDFAVRVDPPKLGGVLVAGRNVGPPHFVGQVQLFERDDDLFSVVEQAIGEAPLNCILIDEAQFLTRDQVFQLGEVTDKLNVPVLAYGLRTDFQGEPFEGSKYLLAWADTLNELKAICHCGSKATMVLRLDSDGNAVTEGSQVEIGGNDRYISMCRKHFKKKYFAE